MPGKRLLFFSGDTVTFRLRLPSPQPGKAWLRTNVGNARMRAAEIIAQTEADRPPLATDWRDLPMRRITEGVFEIVLPLTEPAHLEAKAFFLPQGKRTPLWPPGDNTVLNVKPARMCAANTMYCAFVRQFGNNKDGNGQLPPDKAGCPQALDDEGWTAIPPSGTFRDFIGHLDFIIHELGCRVIQLLPIHPTPTVHARMGRFGSPYASLSFFSVDPALAVFDPAATPLDQFLELVDAVHARQGLLYLDMAVNHTGWAARIHETHPEWLKRDEEGRIVSPGAWGVVWEDLTQLDYSHRRLWEYMAGVFLTWCRRGVDGFRCDAGYMVPVPAWTYITARVRREFPETVFFLEGLGGKLSTSRDILNLSSFDGAYSELFQNYDRSQIQHYLPTVHPINESDGLFFHFSETHDNNRLAAVSPTWASMRTALCALFSPCGAFGFSNGVEWFATEKIQVHEANSLNWGAEPNMVGFINRLCRILAFHHAFHPGTHLSLVHKGPGNQVVLFRNHAKSGKKLLVAVNLDHEHEVDASWSPSLARLPHAPLYDLVSGNEKEVSRSPSAWSVRLGPGQAVCLTPDKEDLEALESTPSGPAGFGRVRWQALRAMALGAWMRTEPSCDLAGLDPDQLAHALKQDPLEFCRFLNKNTEEPLAAAFTWPRDENRVVMLPPGHFLLIRSPLPFRARLVRGVETLAAAEALETDAGGWFALVSPPEPPREHEVLDLVLTVYENGGGSTRAAKLLLLSDPENARAKVSFDRDQALSRPLLALGTNGRGGMMRAHARFGELASKYDALLAANLSSLYPEDRRVLFSRCRAWVVFQGYSREFNQSCLESFAVGEDSSARWLFAVPTFQRQHVLVEVCARMVPERNAVVLEFSRQARRGRKDVLADAQPVTLILRPDVEDRSFHETTKAFTGPEEAFPRAISAKPGGFSFALQSGQTLSVRLVPGAFNQEPLWTYMVHRPLEAERGMDPDSDLFSPGWFSTELFGGKKAMLTCGLEQEKPSFASPAKSASLGREDIPLKDALRSAMDHYVVRRGKGRTVIAGYPWFLDWGRDSLIFLRGYIAAGRTRESQEILKNFARFEDRGTLPNMIRGNDAGDRDTSDAPLWFLVALSDLVQKEGNADVLAEDCGGRTMGQVAESLVRSIMDCASNGVAMDPETGLLFSPAHFTWMDTNYPAATPREGYPVEIQALWHAGLVFLANHVKKEPFDGLARKVRQAVEELYPLKQGYLSDCLLASPGTGARQARPDDALRPNQLLAVTLGAVRDRNRARSILAACEQLLVPGAIRSLADRPVSVPLVVERDGVVLNDPLNPYWGTYQGDEDTRRKPAYHNGTAWTWLFPSYAEAWALAYGKGGEATARAWLGSATVLLNQGAAGHLPEIVDGNAPHAPRGCDAQAWAASEFFRVLLLLSSKKGAKNSPWSTRPP